MPLKLPSWPIGICTAVQSLAIVFLMSARAFSKSAFSASILDMKNARGRAMSLAQA